MYNDKLKYLILIIAILILMALNLYVFINNYYSEEISKENIFNDINNIAINTNYEVSSKEDDEENRINKIATLTEKQRMQTYFGQYISNIENKNYEEAYNLLYDGFKQNYFNTLEDFIEYVQKNYPDNIVVEYTNIERQGTLFILSVEIKDVLNSMNQENIIKQQIVIIENDVNDFKLSFSVLQ